MIRFRWEPGCEPVYKTKGASGADLRAAENRILAPGEQAKVRTGVWIEEVLWDMVPPGAVPEVQLRARSGLSAKHGIALVNGVGTVDCDYREEICILMWNTSSQPFTIQKGDRIAQALCSLSYRMDIAVETSDRLGGFGSTLVRDSGLNVP